MILQICRGEAKRRDRPVLEPVFLVGRGSDCDLVLGDPQFDPVHFYILTRHGHAALRLIGHSPELTINGTPARTNCWLREGDRIRTGPFEFLVRR